MIKDPLAKALGILQDKVKLGHPVKLSKLVTKKGGEAAMREAIMTLIDAGWSEYQFTDSSYRTVMRTDLPDFARNYFKELREEKYENIKTFYSTPIERDAGSPHVQSIGGKVPRSRPKRDRVQLSREQLGELQPTLF
ncbi:hypothetical protein [Sphingobacterium kyonggiense]